MRLKTIPWKRAAAVLAAACTLGTCCIAGSVAWAAEDQTQGANTADISSTCGVTGSTETKCTSITIHKYNSPSITSNDFKANGTDMTAALKKLGVNKPLQGVQFTLYKVQKDGKDIDLSKPEGWKKIEDLKGLTKGNAASFFTAAAEDQAAKFTKVPVGQPQETDSNGVAKFDGLAESLYYVEETSTTNAKMDYSADPQHPDVKPITVTYKTDPFFVTTPLSHQTKGSWEWLYNVHVFPKNDVNKDVPTKTAADPNKYYVDENKNTVIPWNISIPLSAPSEGKTYKQIGFVDSLPTGLNYSSVTGVMLVKMPKPTTEVPKPKSSDIPLSGKTKTSNGDYEASDSSGKVTFKLTSDGLAKLIDLDKNTYTLKVTLNTSVTKGTKNFTNFITGWIDNSKIGDGDENNPCVPTKEEPNKCDNNPHGSSHFATLKITKVAVDAEKKNTNKTLKGAKFAIYSVNDQSTDLTAIKDSTTLGQKTTPVKTSATSSDPLTIETGDDGTAKVDLFIGNGAQASSKKYCLVETDAPAGFKKDPAPHCYDVVAETDTNVKDGVVADNSKTIGNDKATELDKIISALPMTGARGLVILTLCGIVGIAGTFFYIVMKRRKEQEQE